MKQKKQLSGVEFLATLDKLSRNLQETAQHLEDPKRLNLEDTLTALKDRLLTTNDIVCYNRYLLFVNEVFDMVSNDVIKYEVLWKDILDIYKSKLQDLNTDVLTNAIYYFSKFQKGDNEFWIKAQNAVSTNLNSFSAAQLSRLILALAMADQECNDLYKKILGKLVDKKEELGSKDTFYLVMTISRNKIPQTLTAEVQQVIAERISKHITEFDLFQISRIAGFISTRNDLMSPEFWSKLESVLTSSIGDFKKHAEHINKSAYLTDFIKSLIPLSFADIPPSIDFLNSIEEMVIPNITELSAEMCQQLCFIFWRNKMGSPLFWEKLSQHIADSNFLEKSNFSAMSLLIPLSDYNIPNEKLWKQLEDTGIKLLKNPESSFEEVTTFGFCFQKMGLGNDTFWDLFDKRVNDAKKSDYTLESAARVAACLSFREVKDNKAWASIEETLKDTKQQLDTQSALLFGAALSRDETMHARLWPTLKDRIFTTRFMKEDFVVLFVSYSQTSLGDEDFWNKIRFWINSNLSSLNLDDIFELHMCLAIEGIYDAKIWEKFEKELVDNIGNIDTPELIRLLWSFSKVNRESQQFWETVKDEIVNKRLGQMDNKGLANLCISLKDNKQLGEWLWQKIAEDAIEKRRSDKEFNLAEIITAFEHKGLRDLAERMRKVNSQ